MGEEEARTYVVTSIEEGEFFLSLLARSGTIGARVLEVGSGLGILSAYLSSLGFEVIALEPGGTGFEANSSAGEFVQRVLGGKVKLISKRVECLSREEQGVFDFIYSNNVLEHVDDFNKAIGAMDHCLAPGSRMLHNCPNYTVPFEPHLGIPLIPFAPAATRCLLPRRIRESGLWRSLNFITAKDIRRLALHHGATVEFERATFADSLKRLSVDPSFSSRHRLLSKLQPVIKRAGIIRLAERLPPEFSTPMIFSWQPAKNSPS